MVTKLPSVLVVLGLALLGPPALVGCCIGAGLPLAPPSPAEPPSIAPPLSPSWPPPSSPSSVPPVAPMILPRPFELDPSSVPQIDSLRSRFDAARPTEGALLDTVLVCSATLHNGGFDVFAGGADVALAMRVGTGALRGTPQSAERVYSFPVRHLVVGDSIWVRVIDRDLFVDDTIAEGSTAFARTPFTLTMGQADVTCRALDPALVATRRGEHLDGLRLAIELLPIPAPDVSATDLGYPHAQVERVRAALAGATAWMDPSDPSLTEVLAPTETWVRDWDRAARDAVASAERTLPAAGTAVTDGERRLSIVRQACGTDAMTLRTELAIPDAPGGCIVLLHVEDPGTGALVIDAARVSPPWGPDTWALDRAGARLPLSPLALREGGAWRRVDGSTRIPSGGSDVAFFMEPGADAVLMRVGAPLGHGLVLRVR
jgi:hypothetical protein